MEAVCLNDQYDASLKTGRDNSRDPKGILDYHNMKEEVARILENLEKYLTATGTLKPSLIRHHRKMKSTLWCPMQLVSAKNCARPKQN